MMTLDPYFVRVKQIELMHEIQRIRQADEAKAGRATQRRPVALRLPFTPRRPSQPGSRAA